MANNEECLIPFNELTKEEHRKIASKGGKASVEARRNKKAMRQQAELLLSLPHKDAKAKKELESLGINVTQIDNQMVMITAMWQKALKGDVQAATWLRDLVGEKPIEEVKVNTSIDSTIIEIESYVEKNSE